MSERIVELIINCFGDDGSIVFKNILIFVVSLMPILELRGGLLLAAALHLNMFSSYIICIIGNILPVPFILLLINKILNWMRNSKRLCGIAKWLDSKVEKHKGQIEKYGYLGIILFVGIPLPGTGAWTGSLIASVLEMDRKKTFISVIIGVFIASIIMMLVSYGVLAKIL